MRDEDVIRLDVMVDNIHFMKIRHRQQNLIKNVANSVDFNHFRVVTFVGVFAAVLL